MKKDQHNKELMDKLRREVEPAELKTDESKDRCGKNEWHSEEIEKRDVLQTAVLKI